MEFSGWPRLVYSDSGWFFPECVSTLLTANKTLVWSYEANKHVLGRQFRRILISQKKKDCANLLKYNRRIYKVYMFNL